MLTDDGPTTDACLYYKGELKFIGELKLEDVKETSERSPKVF